MADKKLKYSMVPLIIAHRGASNDAPENTLPAFELAWKQGADAIETDLHLTRDGKIVCIHDKTTQKVAGKKLIIAESTLEELQLLDVGSWFGKQWKGTYIPTLSDVLKIVPEDKQIFLEIKCGQELLPKLYEDLRNSQLFPKQILIISFHTEVVAAIKKTAPELKVLILSGFKRKPISQQVIPTIDDVLKTLRFTHADGYSLKTHKSVTESFVRQILEQGYEYHVWTIDDIRMAQKYRKYGVTSITTNCPGYLKEKLVSLADKGE
ncbi:MAG: glycerophosphodiester phosphodiesterase [Proteobacteria bacterium]|nr:glycerophosphodiester phosphodiesterase [Pseudomonadota bacterium]